MAQQSSIELSLKGGSAIWRGQEDAGYATELGGAVSWKELRNVYLSKDGTEIRRMPGSATGSQMFLGEHIWGTTTTQTPERARISVTAVTAANPTQITISDLHECLDGTRIYLSGHSSVNDGYYTMTQVGSTGKVFTIPFDNSAGSATSDNATVWIQRGSKVHAMMQVDGVPCVVAETIAAPLKTTSASGTLTFSWLGRVGSAHKHITSGDYITIPDSLTSGGLTKKFQFYEYGGTDPTSGDTIGVESEASSVGHNIAAISNLLAAINAAYSSKWKIVLGESTFSGFPPAETATQEIHHEHGGSGGNATITTSVSVAGAIADDELTGGGAVLPAGEARNNIGTWVGSKLPDVTETSTGTQNYDTPGTPNSNAESINDDGVVMWPCPSMRAIGTLEKDIATQSARKSLVDLGRPAFMWDMSIYGRCQIDSLMNRLLIAVPGHGVMMEADIGLRRYPHKAPGTLIADNADKVPLLRWTKALGIPKGIIWYTEAKKDAAGYLDQNEFVHVSLGYIDLITGEAGLPSDPVKVTAGSVTGKYLLKVGGPKSRVVLPETVGLATVLYVSVIDAASSSILRPVAIHPDHGKGTKDEESFFIGNTEVGHQNFTVTTDTDLTYTNDLKVPPERYPILSQFPVGASWVRAVQSRMIKGGDISSTGSNYEVLSAEGNDPSGTPADGSQHLRFHSNAYTKQTPDRYTLRGARASNYALPNSYAGHKVDGIAEKSQIVRLETEVNRTGDHITTGLPGAGGVHISSFKVTGDAAPNPPGTCFLHLDPNRIQYSEQAHPSVVPAVNNLFIDNLKGSRTTAGARVGNQCLVMTDKATYSTGGAMSPRQVNTSVLSLEYGCVAPSSVVEFPGGVAWLSAEGPVVFGGGGVQWVGAGIREKWKDFKRDSLSMMGYAQGAYDKQRDLIVWSLREDRKQTDFVDETSDGEKAKVPSDTLLIWAWRSNVWSIAYRDAESEVHAIAGMEAILSRDSADRIDNVESTICAMHQNDGATASVYPIAVWEDKWADRVKVPEKVTATANKTPGSDNFVIGSSAIGTTAISTGDMVFVRSSKNELRCWGDVGTLTSTAVPITVDGASMTNADWKTGDVMEGRIFHMRLQSNMMRLGRKHKGMVIAGVSLRHEITRDHDPDSEGALAWARVQIELEDGTKYQMSQDYWGDSISTGVSRHTSNRLVNVGEFKVYIDLVGNSQISLRDISVEVIPR